MTIQEAIVACRETGLTGWELVAYAQALVSRTMRYSVENSLDSPAAAFAKGQGYCWHQAKALQGILHGLGLQSRLVHAFRNLFPETVLMGVPVHNFVSGHVWCRITIDGVEKDVCPGNPNNVPGTVHFQSLSPVRKWSRTMDFFTYYGAALFNWRRRRKYGKQ